MSPVRPSWHYVYILISEKDKKFYTGVTNELAGRLEQHEKGLVPSTKYRRPLKLVYYEASLDKDDSYRRERYLKSGMGKKYLNNRLKKGLTG
ncbi:MAG: GIY-YIG nuclease family protein [Candidatus Omnitrophica bacterium]|nr:GIY-YIG nuclease family protein [Candidatus Omnitrophota bacterium]